MASRSLKGKSPTPGPLGLGRLELDVMLYIWKREENGESSTRVKDAFRVFYSEDDLTYTTVMSVFHRLEKKGRLQRLAPPHKTKRLFYYHSTRSRQEVGQEQLDCIAGKFFDGDFMSRLISQESL